MTRSIYEKIFLVLFFPIVIGFYLIYKYPTWFVAEDQVASTFYWLGKSSSFWYSTVYSALVCGIAFKVFMGGKTPYGKNKAKKISSYQRNKFISIFLSQLVLFYFIPYILPYILNGGEFFNDQYAPVDKNAYVYLYNGFTSMGGFIYLFVLVPLSVWFVGKRYCSWFCACGNLSETIGITKWGNNWVTKMTPRGETAKKLESLQYVFLFLAVCYGLLLFFDAWKIFSAPALVESWRAAQDFVVDFFSDTLIGVGAYPFFGTRIWCRYGCPLAASMRIFGKFSKSKFEVLLMETAKALIFVLPNVLWVLMLQVTHIKTEHQLKEVLVLKTPHV